MSQQSAPPEGFVEVENRRGVRSWVPPHWVGHPRLGADLTPVDDLKLVDGQGDERPTTSWNNDRILAWAAEHEVDLGSATTKAELLAAIDAASA